eukprot:1803239-Lingulodinium_polyedra.AAC.1
MLVSACGLAQGPVIVNSVVRLLSTAAKASVAAKLRANAQVVAPEFVASAVGSPSPGVGAAGSS